MPLANFYRYKVINQGKQYCKGIIPKAMKKINSFIVVLVKSCTNSTRV